MTTRCPKCRLEHDRIDVIRWLWLLRDTKPKPPGKAVGILAMLAARMDAKTGCGWTTDPDLAGLAEVTDLQAVRAATRWGRDRLLLHRARKGYRITDERTEKSLWILTDPHQPTGDRLPHGKAPQPGTGSPMATEPTGDLSGANRGSEPDPTGDPSRSIAKPEKLNQEAKHRRRTPRTGSRRRAAATADDDFDSICDKLGATGPQRDLIRSLAGAQSVISDLNAYLRKHLDSDGGESFMRYVHRVTGEADAEPTGQDDDGEEFPF